jgi:ligand-binding sensor domain-containing protein
MRSNLNKLICQPALVLAALVLLTGCSQATPTTQPAEQPNEQLSPATATPTTQSQQAVPTVTRPPTRTHTATPAAALTDTPVPTDTAAPAFEEPTATVEAPSAATSTGWNIVTALNVNLKNLVSVAVAPEQTLWAGSDNNGVFHFDGSTWRQYTTSDGLPDNSAHAFAFAPDGAVWVSTWFGIARLGEERWQAVPLSADYAGNDFHPLALAPDGSVWMGTGRGLLVYQSGEWRMGVPGSNPARHTAFALWIDTDGAVWFGSDSRQLNRLRGGELIPAGPPSPPEGLRINAILRGPDGALWMGTSHGLYRYDQDTWQTPADFGLEIPVQCLAFAPDGGLWLGSIGEGVYRYLGGATQQYTTADGLVDDTIYGISVAQNGVVWVAAPAGLGMLQP